MLDYFVLSHAALQENRDRLMAALAGLGAESATIDYVGGGDSGEVSSLTVSPSDLRASLQQATVVMRCVRGEWRDGQYHHWPEDQSVPLAQALTDFTLDWINSEHGGWENNDGGQGSVTILVADNSFSQEHTEFYTESTCYDYSL